MSATSHAGVRRVLPGGRGSARHPVIATLIGAVSMPAGPNVPTTALPDHVASLPAADVLAIADAHRVVPALARFVAAADSPPAALLEALEPRRTDQRLRHLQTLADIVPLARALDAAGIGWVVVKGPVAAATLWPSPDMRGYLDLDVVVDPLRFAETIDLLHGLGARQLDLNWGLIHRQMRGELSFILAGGTLLDLHWHPVNDADVRAQLRWDVRALLDRRRSVGVGSVDVPTLDAADTLVHMAYHATHSGAYRLLWLKDVECAWAAVTDPAEVVERAEDARLDVIVRTALDRVALVLGRERCPDLPWRSRRGGSWRALLRAVDRRSEVPRTLVAGRTGRTLFTSTRTTSPTSAHALAMEGAQHVRERRDSRHVDPQVENPLHRPDHDRRARDAYLREVGHVSSRSGAIRPNG